MNQSLRKGGGAEEEERYIFLAGVMEFSNLLA